MVPNVGARFERDRGIKSKGMIDRHAFPLPGYETTGSPGGADRRRNKIMGSKSSSPDSLPGTEFEEDAPDRTVEMDRRGATLLA